MYITLVALTSDFGSDLHVLLQGGQGFEVFSSIASHHFLQFNIHLTEPLLIQPTESSEHNGWSLHLDIFIR